MTRSILGTAQAGRRGRIASIYPIHDPDTLDYGSFVGKSCEL